MPLQCAVYAMMLLFVQACASGEVPGRVDGATPAPTDSRMIRDQAVVDRGTVTDANAVDQSVVVDRGVTDQSVTLDQGTASTVLCDTAAEAGALRLDCPAGLIIREILFASYGTPGACPTPSVSNSCNSSRSTQVVSSACIGNAGCSLRATNDTFSDACVDVIKRLTVRVRCAL